MRLLKRMFLYSMVAGLAFFIWAVFIEPSQIKFNEQKIYLQNWPKELDGFSIVLMTDLHVGSPHITLKRMQDIVEKTNALQPDLTLLGGDYVIQGVLGGTPVASADIVTVLAKLKAKYGVFGVLGNHDWWENAKRMNQEFANVKIPMLENRAVKITANNNDFWIVGVSDYSEKQNNLAQALQGVDLNNPVIALSHSPDIFPEIPQKIALTLAGHTHGGQVYVPFLGRPIVPSKYGERYALGLIKEGSKQIFVSSGIGTSILPIRFLTPPEVNILRIYHAQP